MDQSRCEAGNTSWISLASFGAWLSGACIIQDPMVQRSSSYLDAIGRNVRDWNLDSDGGSSCGREGERVLELLKSLDDAMIGQRISRSDGAKEPSQSHFNENAHNIGRMCSFFPKEKKTRLYIS